MSFKERAFDRLVRRTCSFRLYAAPAFAAAVEGISVAVLGVFLMISAASGSQLVNKTGTLTTTQGARARLNFAGSSAAACRQFLACRQDTLRISRRSLSVPSSPPASS